MVGGLEMICICIILGVLSAGGLLYTIIDTDGEAGIAVLCAFGFFFSVAGLIDLLDDSPVTHEFPCTNYSLEYKVTTVGEKSDTTYVLTKIKEE